MRRFIRYDHLGNFVGEVSENDVVSMVRREKINGEHSLEITTLQVLGKNERIVYQDGRGVWREYVIAGVDEDHSAGKRVIGTYYAVWSVMPDLMGVTVSVMPGVQNPVTAGAALTSLLSAQSRWALGTVTRTATGGASMYDMNAWKALGVLVENWGGELSTAVEVGNSGVTGRKVDLYERQGYSTANRRFDFGADLKSIKRSFADSPYYCRISPRGAGEEQGDGYGRKIRITSVNDGKDYLEYAPMVDLAKIPDGDGFIYPTVIVENSDCKTPADLLTWARGVLEETCTPKVTYEVDVIQAGVEGVDVSGVSLGDAVQIVDRYFNSDDLRLSGRIVAMTVDELNEREITVTIGNIKDTLSDSMGKLESKLSTVSAVVQNMNGGTFSTTDYMSNLLGRINAQINATGGYTYITQGQGLRTYDKAVSDPLVGAEADSVVELKGGTIRIANSRTAQGDWEWKTVFTSGHIAANLVTAANLTAGYIGNSSGGSYWDLDNDILRIGSTSSIGGHTVSEILNDVDGAVSAATDAAKVATNYLTFDSNNGLDIGYSGTSAKTRLNASGEEVFDGNGDSAAFLGIDSNSRPYARVGNTSDYKGNVEIKSPNDYAMQIAMNVGDDPLLVCAYDSTNFVSNEYNENTTMGPYVTVGTRKSGKRNPGNNSIAIGDNNYVRSQNSLALGPNNTVGRPTSIAIGSGNTVEPGPSRDNQIGGYALGYNLTVKGPYTAVGTQNLDNARTQTWAAFVVGGGGNSGASTDPWTGSYNAMVVDYDGDVTIGGTLSQSSDRRLKDHIDYLSDDAVEFVRNLKPALFVMKGNGKRRLGFYAQDVQDAEPDGWDTDTVTENGMSEELPDSLALDYTALIAPLVAYVQSLEKRIEQLEMRLTKEEVK